MSNTNCKRRVLVVDDVRAAADTMARLLTGMGYDSRAAYDGAEALQIASSYRPNIVLLDLNMPKMDGYEAARRIRSEPWGESTDLVALSGWAQEDFQVRALEAGFNHLLSKPMDPISLRDLLQRIYPT